jgi:hydroxymethylpyrimidine/phosphomethylpyrimidine kinase
MKKTLLSIAGFDPSGGAGVLADLRVFRELGFHGAAALTALTVQNTSEVKAVEAVRPALLTAQVEAADEDLVIAGIKVGMAATAANLRAAARLCAARPDIPRVVDPVFHASAGPALLERSGRAAFVSAFRGRATVITPNLDEAGILTGTRISTLEGMIEAAREISRSMDVPCLVKGGHLAGEAVDVLFDGRKTFLYGRPRLRRDVHGTGCVFSAALTASLAQGNALDAAVRRAADFTHKAIAGSVRVGRGRRVYSPP